MTEETKATEADRTLDDRIRGMLHHAFPRCTNRREMMCRRFEMLAMAVDRGDVDDVQVALGDFLMTARSLHDVIGSEGKSIEGFSEWWSETLQQVKQDPLMRWAHVARIDDFHHGIPSIEVIGWSLSGGLDYEMQPEANQVVTDQGMFWFYKIGTVEERIRRVPIRSTGLAHTVRITGIPEDLPNTPASISDLLNLCRRVMEGNQKLVYALKEKFGGTFLRTQG